MRRIEGVKAETSGFLFKERENLAMDYAEQVPNQDGHAAK